MNLFYYLMNKNDKILVDNNHMLEYLLNKSGTEKEVSGTEINITDVTKEKIIKLTLDKESTQDGTPTPDNPIEVKTVKGNVGITITDGTNTRNYTIPLGNNEIVGIGNYKDELIVDKNGHCWLNKKTGKVVLNGSEDWTQTGTQYEGLYSASITKNDMKRQNVFSGDIYSNYFVENSFGTQSEGITKSLQPLNYDYIIIRINNTRANTLATFKEWLSTHNTDVYYVLATEQLIDLNYTADIRLFNGVNNISNSDNMYMVLKYY